MPVTSEVTELIYNFEWCVIDDNVWDSICTFWSLLKHSLDLFEANHKVIAMSRLRKGVDNHLHVFEIMTEECTVISGKSIMEQHFRDSRLGL